MNDTLKQKNNTNVARGLIGLFAGLVIAVGILLYGNQVVDAILASRYVPTSEIAGIHDMLQLTGEGSNLLYASAPVIETGQSFNSACESTERTQAILGCYNLRKIYLYDVVNPELAGAKEVTAAHEMLHAAYERLNVLDRPRVDQMMGAEYQKLKGEPELKKLVDYYEKAEPGSLNNELHSILGTIEVELSPELEAYYARYFKNRAAIVAMDTKYSAVFSDVEQRVAQLTVQIEERKPEVEASLSGYQTDLAQLNTDIADFNAKTNAGVFRTTSAFNAARQALVSRVNAINARRESVNADITAYNALVAEQNKLAVRVEQLNSSINAAPAAGGL